MRHLTKPPNHAAAARASDAKANEEAGLKSISLSSIQSSTSSSASGKKKPVFKSTLEPHNAAALGVTDSMSDVLGNDADPSGAVANGWEDERYDPRFVSGCDDPRCRFCKDGRVDLGVYDEGRDVEMRD